MVSKLENIGLPPALSKEALNSNEIDLILNNFLSQIVRAPVKSETGSLNDFFELVKIALISKQRAENVDESKKILYVEEDPPETLDQETITFHLQSREPGTFGKGSPGTKGPKELTPHLRRIDEHPDLPNEKIITFGQLYDNVIKFNIYAKTNKQARIRLFWFEQVMYIYSWFYRLFGYRPYLYGVGDRERIKIGKNDIEISKYPVAYFLKTDEVFHTSEQELKTIVYTAGIDTTYWG